MTSAATAAASAADAGVSGGVDGSRVAVVICGSRGSSQPVQDSLAKERQRAAKVQELSTTKRYGPLRPLLLCFANCSSDSSL